MSASESEGAKFWMQTITELKDRAVADIFIACVEGLKGFPEAIEAIFPKTQVQMCMVHLVRHSLSYLSHGARKDVATALKAIYQAATLAEAEEHLNQFEVRWRESYPVIARSWRGSWSRVVSMFGYPAEIRRVMYTTNTIESLNMRLRKLTKNRSLFPNDEAVFKLMYLGLKHISQRWTMPIKNWSGAMNQFAILFEGRVPIDGLSSNSLTQNPV
jgi:putative transposase